MKIKAKQQKTKMHTREDVSRSWFILDASGKTLGRFASEVSKILRGKHRVDYTPHIDCGDGVIIINADKIRVTGAKEAQKVYREYTGFIGGMKETPYRIMKARKPEYIIRHAVLGMMPRNKLTDRQATRLRIFKNEASGLDAQKPVKANV